MDKKKSSNKLVEKLRKMRMNLEAKISELESYGVDTTPLKKNPTSSYQTCKVQLKAE